MAIFDGTIAASPDALLDASTRHYLTSGDFNGTPVRLIEADDATTSETDTRIPISRHSRLSL